MAAKHPAHFAPQHQNQARGRRNRSVPSHGAPRSQGARGFSASPRPSSRHSSTYGAYHDDPYDYDAHPRRGSWLLVFVVVALCVGLAGFGVAFATGTLNPFGLFEAASSSEPAPETISEPEATLEEAPPEPPSVPPATVSLSAVGDNLIHMPVVNTADAAAGEMGDGVYDFSVLYTPMKEIIDTHDLNFIDIETIIGGDDRGPSGYPTFNTPSQDAAAIASFGFNLATTATNHTWDQGFEGIQNSSAYWAEHPEVIMTGSFVSEEDRGTIRTFEKNGITFAFLAYQDYLNGFELPEDQKWAIADSNDREAVQQDLDKAHELAECVIVAMSWGDEYAFEPNESQRDFAQFLANNNVDVVLGFGPHVIQPVEWVGAQDEAGAPTGHQTMVVFSLGNFVSNQQNDFNLVEGCFTCNIDRNEAGEVSIQNPTWIPLVAHFSGGTGHTVYPLKNYPAELAATNDVLGAKADPLGYARDLTTEIINPEVVSIDLP